MKVILFAILAFLILAVVVCFFLMRDFRRKIGERVLSAKLPRDRFIDLGEYTVTAFMILFVSVMAILFYKSATALAAYLLSDDLVSFYVILRAVFTIRSGTEYQSPFILEHFLYGFFIVPVLQFLTCYLILSAFRFFAASINRKYDSTIYSDRDMLSFSFWATVLFMIGELISYSQHLSWLSGLAHFIYLALSNLSLLCFYLAVSHIYQLNSFEYVARLPDYFIFSRWQKIILNSPVYVTILAYVMGVLLHAPFTFGVQFENNLLIVLTLIPCCALYYFILKHFFKRGGDLIGAVMMEESSDNRLQDAPGKMDFSFLNNQKLVKYSLVFASIIILMNLKFSVFSLFFLLLITVILVVLHIVFYVAGLVISLLRAGLLKIPHPRVRDIVNYNYVASTGLFALLSVRSMLLTMLALYLLISFFPKNYAPAYNHTVPSVLDENGYPLFIQYNKKNISIPVEYEQVPDFLLKVLYLQEDRSFTDQHGWLPKWSNWNGISLASFYRFITRSGGGSNLNMQLLKNEAFPNKRFPQDIQRKFVEAVASYQLSRQLTHEEIVTRYLNIVGMNGGIGHTGVMAASLHTFNRPLWDLNELEMLYLVSTLTSGSGFRTKEGFVGFDRVVDHADDIKNSLIAKAQVWHDRRLLTTRELRMLENQVLRFVNRRISPQTEVPTRDFLISELQRNNSLSAKTYTSTLTVENQRKMRNAIQSFESRFREHLRIGDYVLYSSALVVEIRTGNIIGHYGGSGPSDLIRFINGFPTGSLIKPFLFLELLEMGFPSDMKLYDGPIPGKQTPRNDGHPYLYKYVGLNEILAKSLNAPVVNIRQLTDPLALFHSVEDRFREMGIEADHYLDLENPSKYTEHELNYPLGSRKMTIYDMAQVYQVLFNEGRQIELSIFKEYYNRYNFSNEKIRKVERTIYSRENVFIIKSALRGTMLPDGTGYHLRSLLPPGRTYYAKTGTTDGALHGHTVLSDGDIMIVTWVSYGKVENGLELNQTPAIPYSSGGHSAGVLAAMVYNQFAGWNR